VPAGAYFAQAALWLKSVGVTTGYGSPTTFAPGAVVTRGQMAAFLHRLVTLVFDADPDPDPEAGAGWRIDPAQVTFTEPGSLARSRSSCWTRTASRSTARSRSATRSSCSAISTPSTWRSWTPADSE
jgi:hypothetical protein